MFKKMILIPLTFVAMTFLPVDVNAACCPDENVPSNEKSEHRQGKENFKQWMVQMKKYKHDFLIRELSLADGQKDAFLSLYDKMEDEKWALGRDVRRMEREIMKKGDNATELELEKAADAAVELSGKQSEVELRYHAEFKKVLTKRQLFQLKAAERKFQKSLMEQRGKNRKKN